MGASRKLQGEIDRVLKKVNEGVEVFGTIWNKVYNTENVNQKEKYETDLKKEIKKLQRYRDQIKTWLQSSEIKDKKVSASYEQALIDSRRLIEKEMERFKICEKETKTKAFSKEGLEQQPKTDPKEKAKSETRDWLNNTVSELESQIDSFEAEIEGLPVRKGKTRPLRLTHLETSITRHKAHIVKLELILRLLDNDELGPEQVNDVKDFLDDYVERNQEDFEEFDDVDMLYNTLSLEKLELLEDLVTIGPPALAKGVVATGTVPSIKSALSTPSAQSPATVASSIQQGDAVQKQVDEKAPRDGISEFGARTPLPKKSAISSAPPTPAGTHATTVAIGASSVHSDPTSAKSILDISTSSVSSSPMNNATRTHATPVAIGASSVRSDPSSVKSVLDISTSSASSSPMNIAAKEGTNSNFPGRKTSPAFPEPTLCKRVTNLTSITIPTTSVGMVSSDGCVALETPRRAMLGDDERLGGGIVRPLVSSSSSRMMLPQGVKTFEAVSGGDSSSNGEGGGVKGRIFSGVPGIQWRPGNLTQSQHEGVPVRTEIAPDHREQFLQRYQQAQQAQQLGQGTLLGMPSLSGGNLNQFIAQQNPLHQVKSQSSAASPQGGRVGGPAPGFIAVTSAQQHPSSIHSQSAQHTLTATGSKDTADELQRHQSLSHDSTSTVLHKNNTANEEGTKVLYTSVTQAGVSGTVTEPAQVTQNINHSPRQPLQSSQTASLGVIGRRNVPDFGAHGDNLSGSAFTFGASHDQQSTLQLLESAFHKLPQPKDSERKSYTPRHPTVTPQSYPKVQDPIVSKPAFWERLGSDNIGLDTLFFAFYYQQNTYQQYLAAKELKKQAWRYHKDHSTWFQRHEEPQVASDEFELGTYLYFDSNLGDDEMQNGWCQRIKTDFKFEYQFLEDELVV